MQAVRSGEAIAVVYIPENFERDLLARKRPQVVSLYNRQYLTPGNNAASSISSAVSAATAALPHEEGGGTRNEMPRVRLTERWRVPLDIDVLSPAMIAARRVPVV